MPNQKAASSQLGRKVDNAENAKELSQKQKVASPQLGRKVDHVETAKELTPKSKKARAVSSLNGQEVHKEESTKQAAALKSKKGGAILLHLCCEASSKISLGTTRAHLAKGVLSS